MADSYATKSDLGLGAVRDELKAEIRALHVAALRLESTMQMFAERLHSQYDELARQMTEVEERLSARLATVEQIARQSSEAHCSKQ